MSKRPFLSVALAAFLALGAIGPAFAALPAPPPPTDAEKAAAAAKKAKAEEAKKQEAEALEKAMDRAVENYRRNQGLTSATMPAQAVKK
jgi:hypothetical protein